MNKRKYLPPGGANAIEAAKQELAPHARHAFEKDIRDLLRGQLAPDLADVQQAIGMAADLCRRRGDALISV